MYQVDTRAAILCIQLVKEVMTEMNTWTTSATLTEHRRVAVSFRSAFGDDSRPLPVPFGGQAGSDAEVTTSLIFRDNHLMTTFEITAVMLVNAARNLQGIKDDPDTVRSLVRGDFSRPGYANVSVA